MRAVYGFDRPLPVQYGLWLWKVLQGDLGNSIATGRPVLSEVSRAVDQLADPGVGRDADRLHASAPCSASSPAISATAGSTSSPPRISVFGVSVPHYWLGMVLVIVFSVQLELAAADRRRAGRLRQLAAATGSICATSSCRRSRCR